VLIALPDIFRGIGINPLQPGNTTILLWMIMGFLVVTSVLVVSFGRLGDMFGRVRMYNMGFAVFALFSILLSVSWMSGAAAGWYLIAMRIFQGVGGAIMFATSLALLGNSFRGKDRGVAFGVWGAITGVSTALGPVLGGVITTNWSWRGIFLVNVPIGVLAVALTAWRVDESKSPRPTPPDWIGFVLLTTGLVSLVYGLIRAGENSFSDTGVILCLAVGAGEQRPIVKNGALAIATVMSCTLSCDHRAVDGAVGAQFLAAFKKLVEDPLTMLL